MTSLEVATVEFDSEEGTPHPANASVTKPLPENEVAQAISDVVARADEDYARDLVTVLQIKARQDEDTGERLSLAQFADEVGFDLAQLRPE